MNIVVLAGGLSTERDVSFCTGKLVQAALQERGHQAVLVDVFMGFGDEKSDLTNIFETGVQTDTGAIGEAEPDLEAIRAMRADKSDCFLGPNVVKICTMADIVFMALHGENGENGKLQATFDLLGIKYTGTGYLGSALAMDKNLSKQLFIMNGIPNAKGIRLRKGNLEEDMKQERIKAPCIVKPCCGGSSIGVAIVEEDKDYEKAIEFAFKYEDEILVEEFIKGREFSIGVMEGKALPIIEIIPKEGFYDYSNKYQKGKTDEVCPAELSKEMTEEMQKYAELACKVLNIEVYGRVDFLLGKDNRMYCLEVNTLPGMTPTSLLPQEAAVLGISYGELCDKIIAESLKKYC